jgi:threonine/homoserine/homoserine lactone efflux protein
MLNAWLLPLLAFAVAAGVLTITPGVDTALVLRSAASRGSRAGAGAALGVCGGLVLWGAGAAFGLTALLAASEFAFTVIKWLGAAYLVWLGLKLLIKPRQVFAAAAQAKGEPQRRGGLAEGLRRGFLTNVLNPKVGVFYVTLLPQFIPQHVNVAVFCLLLAGVHVGLTLAWFSVLIALTVPLGRLLAAPRVVRLLDRLTGCVFVAFGAKLAAAHRG